MNTAYGSGWPQRDTVPRALGNTAAHVRELERIVGGSGWRFNVDNEGGWGYVIANDSTDIGFGENGLLFGDLTGEGVKLFSRFGSETTTVELIPGGFTVSTGTFTVLVSDTEGYISGLASQITVDANGVRVNVASGKAHTVFDSGNNPIFRVDENGDLHGLTGKTLVFDL